MRILILGNNYSAKRFFELFKKDVKNIVFLTADSSNSVVDVNNPADISEFCLANEINLVLITEERYIDLGIQELISSMNISVFAPSIEAVSICSSKSFAKKFMYKNKIKTPRFQIFEKPAQALEYFRLIQTPQAIKPDNHNYFEGTLFAETYNEAEKIINNLFSTGNRKVVLEDYIEGKNISAWALSDGFSAKITGLSAKYQNNVSLFEPDFVSDSIKNTIYNEALMPTVEALASQGDEYIGILGLDFILTYSNELFLVGYNSFFDDLNVDFFIQGFDDLKWEDVFDSTIVGDVFLKHSFCPKEKYMLTLRQGEEIKFICANTKTNLKRYLSELDFNLKEYNEARKIWKY